MDDVQIDHEVDARNLRCPAPLLQARLALNRMDKGQVLKIVATDPGSVADIARLSQLTGHQLLLCKEQSGTFTYLLKKHG